jgi:hypothetical protein
MEDTRFDDFTKTLGTLATRRLTFGVLLAGALGHLGLGAVDARKGKPSNGGNAKAKTSHRRGKAKSKSSNSRAKTKTKTSASHGQGGQGVGSEARSGACAPACGTCQTCKRGKCRTTPSGKRLCKRGSCRPLSGIACTPAGGGGVR